MEIMLRVLIKYMSGMNSSKQDNKWVKSKLQMIQNNNQTKTCGLKLQMFAEQL